jgi:hypothetical protein
MVAERQRKTINRPKSMYPPRAKVNETYLKSIEAMQAGKPAVWAMLNFCYGDPILKAVDIEVVRPENYGTIAAAMGVAQQYLDRADADGLPAHLCGYRLTTLGYASRIMKELNGQIPPEAPFANRKGSVRVTILTIVQSTELCRNSFSSALATEPYFVTQLYTEADM